MQTKRGHQRICNLLFVVMNDDLCREAGVWIRYHNREWGSRSIQETVPTRDERIIQVGSPVIAANVGLGFFIEGTEGHTGATIALAARAVAITALDDIEAGSLRAALDNHLDPITGPFARDADDVITGCGTVHLSACAHHALCRFPSRTIGPAELKRTWFGAAACVGLAYLRSANLVLADKSIRAAPRLATIRIRTAGNETTVDCSIACRSIRESRV